MMIVVKDEGKISEESCLELKPVAGLVMSNNKINSLTSKNSCLVESNVVGGKFYSLEAPCFDDGVCCRVEDVLPLKAVDSGLLESQSLPSTSDQTVDDEMDLEIHTPAKCIFDPFAPGVDDVMLLSPKRKKLKKSFIKLQRRLDFGSDSKEIVESDEVKDSDDEELLFYSISNSVFELVISVQLQDISAETMVTDSDISEGYNTTPISLPLLPRTAENCPPAPLKRKMVFERHCNGNICRKLEFEVS